MKAAYLEASGGPEAFVLGELPDPIPSHGEVLIAVSLASLNHQDTIFRSGIRPYFKIVPPHILGREVTGTVVDVGDDVTGLKVGSRVIARAKTGSYASLAVADQSLTFALPDAISFEDAAGFGVSAPTAYRIVMRRAEILAGQQLLVTAAASGVGTLLVQIGLAAGAHVIATAGSAEKREQVQSLGVTTVLDHYREDIAAQIMEATGGAGLHAVADAVSDQRLFDAAFSCLRTGAKYVSYGNIASSSLNFNVTALFGKGIEIRGLHGVAEIEASEHKGDVECILGLARQGKLRTVLDHIRPLDEVSEAHRLMEQGHLFGKIALAP